MRGIKTFCWLATALLIALTCQAQTVTVPHTFEAGTPAKAEEVNANFAALAPQGAVYRWAVFDTYGQNFGWVMGNDSAMFGGVNPSNWTDANGTASQMSSDKEVLRTLFTQKGYAGKNGMVHSSVFHQYSSTTGKVLVVLFRVKNTTANPLTWAPYFYYTAYGVWGESASVALNGANTWSAGSPGQTSVSLQLPANRVSTVIFVSTSSPPYSPSSLHERVLQFGFYNNSLQLPAGLVFVDDLDRATGGWDQ